MFFKSVYNFVFNKGDEEDFCHDEISSSSGSSSYTARTNANGNQPLPLLPKHIPFPEYSLTAEIINELILSLFALGSAILQFINIYHANGWLPDSYTDNSVVLYLVDRDLAWVLVVIMARRLFYCAILAMNYDELERGDPLDVGMNKLNTLVITCSGFFMLMGYQVYRLAEGHNTELAFFLAFPCIIYLCYFGYEMEPLLRTAVVADGVYINGMPVHSCRMNAAQIRSEIRQLRNDFNKRLKQAIFTSVTIAYYTGLLPCILAVQEQYNVQRAIQHIISTLIATFMLCVVSLFPAKYCDILHRASLHLGYWQRIDIRQESSSFPIVFTNTVVWCKNVMYPNNSVVKYNGIVYRSRGLITVAIPGSKGHARFNKWFHDPANIYMRMAIIQTIIIFIGITLIYGVPFFSMVEWHYQGSFAFAGLTNMYSFFYILRDFLIARRLYHVESATCENLHKKT